MNISVIVITRNRPGFLGRCLQSLIKHNSSNFEILVVDSSDTLSTKILVEQNFNRVRYLFLKNGKNKMPISRNLGIRHAAGDIIAFLDDDAVVLPGWLDACLSGYVDSNVGGVGGRIIDIDGVKIVSNTKLINGEKIIGIITKDILGTGNFHLDTKQLTEVSYLRGCNMSFRKKLLCTIGGFDGNYTGDNFMEEMDVCLRIEKLGYKLYYNPQMAIEHRFAPRESIPRDGQYVKRKFYTNKNKIYFAMNNMYYKDALNYAFFKDTGVPALIRKPSLRNFLCLLSSFIGKVCGILNYFTYLFKKRSGIYIYMTHRVKK